MVVPRSETAANETPSVNPTTVQTATNSGDSAKTIPNTGGAVISNPINTVEPIEDVSPPVNTKTNKGGTKRVEPRKPGVTTRIGEKNTITP
jgi:hypothetical protein